MSEKKAGEAGNPGAPAAIAQKSFDDRKPTGTLYLVGTPIGNLEDMTFRAIRTLKEADLIAAEDTRQSRKLLTHFDISNRLVSYHEHNKAASGPELIRLLLEGKNIALISDAGMPAISDPGADLAAAAIGQGIPVVPIPGANAALAALTVSGLSTERFTFVGFPPRERKGMERLLAGLGGETGTLVFYESPHRLVKTLQAFADKWPNRRAAVIRELTKRHEEAVRGTVQSCLAHFREYPPLGEICIVLEGRASAEAGGEEGERSGEPASAVWWEPLTVAEHVEHYEKTEKANRKEAMRLAARDRGLSRRDIYQSLLER
ncbi:16S rRNA (cytidine(1402)-2'-O)-methyltransferase [Cohnella massiliensis]|uniref:16S rRNA (cytidine(1402)-2'-O)-methyltransferase n=1 Tax=Cohnella massiliensis TaxID=1816691 RepID=UPI0009BB2450|nr:16S rRNA (cytidine(1402)-2'-O)-methyltransferase [Cohnella massiliensis]